MPAVLRENGLDVYIYTHDHRPRHVHVWRAEAEVVINLGTLDIREFNRKATNRFIRQAWELVAENVMFLISEWERINPVP